MADAKLWQMRVLRMIKGVTRMDCIRNERIQQELDVEPVGTFIEKNQLRWLGHLLRMEESRLPLKWYKWKPQRKRPIGRPRRRWIDTVQAALEKRSQSMDEVMQAKLYEDRTRWRKLISYDEQIAQT